MYNLENPGQKWSIRGYPFPRKHRVITRNTRKGKYVNRCIYPCNVLGNTRLARAVLVTRIYIHTNTYILHIHTFCSLPAFSTIRRSIFRFTTLSSTTRTRNLDLSMSFVENLALLESGAAIIEGVIANVPLLAIASESVKENSDPVPGVDFTAIVPPCKSMIFLAMLSPRPVQTYHNFIVYA